MPTLRSWQVHHPSAWTQRQRDEYAHDAAQLLMASMTPVVQFAGPGNALHMMFAVMKHICAANPAVIDATLDSALDWCADVAKIPHDTEGRTLN